MTSSGTRTAKGIGAAFSGTSMSLERAGIRPDETADRRTVRGGLLWTAGPRLRQTRQVLERARRYRIKGACEEVPLKGPPAGDMRPVLVLRALGSRGNACRFDSSLAERAASPDDSLLDIPDDDIGSIGETSRPPHRARPRRGRSSGPRKLRGEREPGARRARLRPTPSRRSARHRAVSAAERAARRSAPGARRSALVAAASQVEAVCARRSRFPDRGHPGWREVGDGTRIRHGQRIGAHDPDGRWSAPPLQARLHCWYGSPDPRLGQIHRPPRGGSARRRCAHGDPNDRALARVRPQPRHGPGRGRPDRQEAAQAVVAAPDMPKVWTVAPVPRRETGAAIVASIGGTAARRCKEGPLFSGSFTVSSVRFEHEGPGRPDALWAVEGTGEVRRTALGQGCPVVLTIRTRAR